MHAHTKDATQELSGIEMGVLCFIQSTKPSLASCGQSSFPLSTATRTTHQKTTRQVCTTLGSFPGSSSPIAAGAPTSSSRLHLSAEHRDSSSCLPYRVVSCARRQEEPLGTLGAIGAPPPGKDPRVVKTPTSGWRWGEGDWPQLARGALCFV